MPAAAGVAATAAGVISAAAALAAAAIAAAPLVFMSPFCSGACRVCLEEACSLLLRCVLRAGYGMKDVEAFHEAQVMAAARGPDPRQGRMVAAAQWGSVGRPGLRGVCCPRVRSLQDRVHKEAKHHC